MILMNVIEDVSMPVPGFEHHNFRCSDCGDIERRFVFMKHGRESDSMPIPVHAAPSIAPAPGPQDEQIAAPGLLGRVVARLRGH
jgi:hypothetical protein